MVGIAVRGSSQSSGLESRHGSISDSKDSVDAFVTSGGIPTSGLGARHVVIVVGTRLAFLFGEYPLLF
jgi:hypothetical protein